MIKTLMLAVILPLAVPASPQTLHGLNWTWMPVTTNTKGQAIVVTGYNVYCANLVGGPFNKKANASLLPTPTFVMTGIVGLTYYCQFTAVLGTLESNHSATATGTIQ